MTTRKVKDAKDLSTNELIYFKGHAKATYMSNGSTVEDAINNIEVGPGINLSDYATKEDLNSKQDVISDIEVIRQGAAKGATALQSYTEQYKGTVTGVKVNGTTKNPSNGVVDLGTVITSHQDISGKQDKLVSGTNIKTINGESILGSGDIILPTNTTETDPVFTASPAYAITNDRMNRWDNKMSEVPIVNHGNGNTTFELTPNTLHIWDEVVSLNLTLAVNTNPNFYSEYMFQFTSGPTATTLTLPSSIVFSKTPVILTNKIYQVSIINDLAVIVSF